MGFCVLLARRPEVRDQGDVDIADVVLFPTSSGNSRSAPFDEGKDLDVPRCPANLGDEHDVDVLCAEAVDTQLESRLVMWGIASTVLPEVLAPTFPCPITNDKWDRLWRWSGI